MPPTFDKAPLKFDILATEFAKAPHPIYRKLQELDPAHWYAPLGVWIVSRNEDMRALLRHDTPLSGDAKFWEWYKPLPVDRKLRGSEWFRFATYSGGEPEWIRVRRAVMSVFTGKVIARMEKQVRGIVAKQLEVVAPALDRGETVDLVELYTSRVPVRVIGHVLGITPDQATESWFTRNARVVIRAANPVLTPEQITALDEVIPEFLAFVKDCIADRRANPRDDLLTDFIAVKGENGAPLAEDMLQAVLVALLVAGAETTGSVIAMGIRLLTAHRPQLQLLLDGAVTDLAAFEEVLRMEEPGNFVVRYAKQDFELHGKKIRRGQIVFLPVGAGSVDPRAVPEPECLNLARGETRAIPFGSGPHYCPGAALARLEGSIGLGEFLRRFPEIEVLEDSVEWNTDILVRGPKKLPARRRRSH